MIYLSVCVCVRILTYFEIVRSFLWILRMVYCRCVASTVNFLRSLRFSWSQVSSMKAWRDFMTACLATAAAWSPFMLFQFFSSFKVFQADSWNCTQGRISLLHLDADLYSSYMDILFNLYDLVEIGGYIVCDDCGFIEEAGRAVTDFRLLHNIHAPLQVWQRSKLTRYWQKTAEVQIDLGPLLRCERIRFISENKQTTSISA